MSTMLHIGGSGLRKTFNRRLIFNDIHFEVSRSETLMITGRNGSGKSTLVKILCGLLTPSAGTVVIRAGRELQESERPGVIGLVAPYLQMFEEFTAIENLELAASLRGCSFDRRRAEGLLERVGLETRRKDPVRSYSSGMKQRVKYAFALLHRPPILVLDEPMANLDADGIAMVRDLMVEQRRERILVVATNDLSDCTRVEARVNLDG
jgi:heme exporter protein A